MREKEILCLLAYVGRRRENKEEVNLRQKRNDWDHDSGKWRKINEQKSMIGMKRWKDEGNKRRYREKDYEKKCKET